MLFKELQEREDKVQSLFKQLDFKHLDIQKFRTAAELAKVSYFPLDHYGRISWLDSSLQF